MRDREMKIGLSIIRTQRRQPLQHKLRVLCRLWTEEQFICSSCGRLIFIHLQCWDVLPFCRFQRQWCIKILCPKDPDFYTPLALKRAKGQHLPALEVYKNQSPILLAQFPERESVRVREKRKYDKK